MRKLRNDHCEELASILRRANLVKRYCREHVVRQLWDGGVYSGIVGSADDKGIDIAGVIDLASFRRIEEDAVSRANHRFIT